MPDTHPAIDKPAAKPVPKKRRRRRREGVHSEAEQRLVTDVLANTPGGLTTGQINALAVVLRRPRDMVKQAVAEAALILADRAERYADIHMQTTEAALQNGDAKSLEVAAKASQWALENINVDGTVVVEKRSEKPTGPQINIGIKLGGMNTPSESVVIEGAKVNA